MKPFDSGVAPEEHSRGDMDATAGPCDPFPHRFAEIHRRVDCGIAWQSATRQARLWPHRLPGPVEGRGGRGDRRRRSGDGVRPCRSRVLGRSVPACAALPSVALGGHRSSLGTGGAVVSHRACSVRSAGGVDCQVPSRSECLSLRGGAAGPEWSRAPGTCSLALGQRLGQLSAYVFGHFGAVSDTGRRVCSTRLSSAGRAVSPGVAHLRATGGVPSFRSETRIAGRRARVR